MVTFLASPQSVAINGDAIACGGGAPRRHPLLIPALPSSMAPATNGTQLPSHFTHSLFAFRVLQCVGWE